MICTQKVAVGALDFDEVTSQHIIFQLLQCFLESVALHQNSIVTVLAAILAKAAYWPSKEAVVDNLTVHFKDYTSVRAVPDLQRPKDLESQLLT